MKCESSGHILHGVYLFQTGILQQTETSDSKDGVEDVDHVARSVCETTQIRILSFMVRWR